MNPFFQIPGQNLVLIPQAGIDYLCLCDGKGSLAKEIVFFCEKLKNKLTLSEKESARFGEILDDLLGCAIAPEDRNHFIY